MLITFPEVTVDAERWTGDNDDVITAHLGTEDWRTVKGVVTQVGWWLLLTPRGTVAQMSDEAIRDWRATHA